MTMRRRPFFTPRRARPDGQDERVLRTLVREPARSTKAPGRPQQRRSPTSSVEAAKTGRSVGGLGGDARDMPRGRSRGPRRSRGQPYGGGHERAPWRRESGANGIPTRREARPQGRGEATKPVRDAVFWRDTPCRSRRRRWRPARERRAPRHPCPFPDSPSASASSPRPPPGRAVERAVQRAPPPPWRARPLDRPEASIPSPPAPALLAPAPRPGRPAKLQRSLEGRRVALPALASLCEAVENRRCANLEAGRCAGRSVGFSRRATAGVESRRRACASPDGGGPGSARTSKAKASHVIRPALANTAARRREAVRDPRTSDRRPSAAGRRSRHRDECARRPVSVGWQNRPRARPPPRRRREQRSRLGRSTGTDWASSRASPASKPASGVAATRATGRNDHKKRGCAGPGRRGRGGSAPRFVVGGGARSPARPPPR